MKCNNPCTDYIFGGCGSCSSACHQPPWYYDVNFKGEKSEKIANKYRGMEYINGEWKRNKEL